MYYLLTKELIKYKQLAAKYMINASSNLDVHYSIKILSKNLHVILLILLILPYFLQSI